MIDLGETDLDSAPDGAYYGSADDSDTQNLVFAIDNNGTDTVFLAFTIFEKELSAKKYPMAGGDVLNQLLEAFFEDEDLDISGAEGSVLPIFGFNGVVGEQIGALSLFGQLDYGNSYLEITNIDTETSKISGKFELKTKVTDESGEVINLYTIKNGKFSNLPKVK